MKIFVLFYLGAIVFISSSLFQDPTLEESMKRGSEIYADFCVTCHLEKGEGVANTFPPLAGSDYLKEQREASIQGIKYGQSGELVVNGVTYNGVMTPMGLEDEEVVDVMNFISNSWGNSSDKIVTLEEVEAIQKK
jgi:cytochrome c